MHPCLFLIPDQNSELCFRFVVAVVVSLSWARGGFQNASLVSTPLPSINEVCLFIHLFYLLKIYIYYFIFFKLKINKYDLHGASPGVNTSTCP